MELLQQALQDELVPKKPRKLPKEEPEDDPFAALNPDSAEDRWRRVALRCFFVLQAVRCQAVVLELSQLPSRMFNVRDDMLVEEKGRQKQRKGRCERHATSGGLATIPGLGRARPPAHR